MVIPPNAYPIVINRGSYPIYDIHIRAVDMSYPAKDRDKHALSVSTGEISPGTAWSPQIVTRFGDRDTKESFNIFFIARNGSWQELLRMRKEDGEWERALIVVVTKRVQKSDGTLAAEERVAKVEVTPKFPVGELQSDPDWKLLSRLPHLPQ